MSTELTAAFEGLDPSVIEAVSSPEVMERLNAFIEKSKQPLLANKNEVLTKYATLQKEIQDLGGFDTIKSLAQREAEARAKAEAAAAQSNDVEAVRKQFQTEVEKRDARIKAMESEVLNTEVSRKISSAIREEKGIPELLEPHVRSRLQTSLNADGKPVIKVMNADGTEMLVDGVKAASVKDLIAELKRSPTYARAFDADGKSGTGAKAVDASTQGVANPFLPATRNLSEQNKLARTNPELARTMAIAAGMKPNW